ncbi:coiled-coil domain-containing protein [Sphingomonas sp. RS2018]
MGLRPTTDAELTEDFSGALPDDGAVSGAYEDYASYETPRRAAWLIPTLGVLVSLGWIGGMLWLARTAFPLPPVTLVQFVAALGVVPTLVAVLCLLALRTSRAEAQRFGATARAMRAEAAALEGTIHALSQRIESNRRLLGEQAQSLAAIGDAAASRLQATTSNLNAEANVLDSIGSALERTADQVVDRLATVFDALPRAQAETAALGHSLTTLGLTASERAGELDAALAALSERGRAAEETAGGAAAKLGAHIIRMESSSDAAAARLDAAASGMSDAVDAVLDRAAVAIDESRKGISAQGEAMLAMLGASQAALERSGRDGADALHARLIEVEGAIERITQMIGEQQQRSDRLFETVVAGVTRADGGFERLHDEGMMRAQSLAAALSALTASSDAMSESMRVGDSTARALIGSAETLLTALDASTREIDETLPESLLRLDAHIAESRRLVGTAKPELLALVTAAESTHIAVEAVAGLVTAERTKLADITANLTEALDIGQDKAETMDAVVGEAITRARRFAEEATPGLIEALNRIRETAERAADSAREVLSQVIPQAAQAIETESADAVRRAFARALPQPLAELGHASESAVTAATRASERLAHQLMTIAESTAAVEARIDEERADREESNQDNFARRVSLLIEALNSSSIDISKTFAHEVSDSAWSAYLKGDRGVFTRRAVRLLDTGQAREIARLHDDDPIFREHVNRYIHDFEAMLRQILALRDGSALGVTLLSSDMGKLYVALAQAIERLR